MAHVKLDGISKHYGAVRALGDITLDVPDGEFVVLVGPSGCGKSTLLRAIAGLEDISSGDIQISGRSVTDLPPRARNIAMVFQSYALYPYLTVYDNIAFGLRARKTSEAEVERKVRWAADLLHITPYLERRPRDLSGGQRQRIAIGRAIVREADLYLFDEPLSNLDANLRDGMREELKRLHRVIGKTFIYVTHDQIEAMTLADRIVLMRDGNIAQVGAPLDLFEKPANIFVAGFLGSPVINLLPVQIEDRSCLRLPNGQSLPFKAPAHMTDGAYVWGVRPEHFYPLANGHATIAAEVDVVQPTGARTYVTFLLGEQHLTAELGSHVSARPGTNLSLAVTMDRTNFFDSATGKAIPQH